MTCQFYKWLDLKVLLLLSFLLMRIIYDILYNITININWGDITRWKENQIKADFNLD